LPVDEFHARIEALALVNVANIFSGLEKYRQGKTYIIQTSKCEFQARLQNGMVILR
jgi:hypothetical protein